MTFENINNQWQFPKIFPKKNPKKFPKFWKYPFPYICTKRPKTLSGLFSLFLSSRDSRNIKFITTWFFFYIFLLFFIYSHVSNKCDVTLTDFRKFHPAQNKNPPCTFIDFITKVSIFLQNLMTIFLTIILSYKSLF